MKIKLLFLWISLACCQPLLAQVEARSTDFVTTENRERMLRYLRDTTIGLALKQSPDKLVESQWKSALWAMELTNHRSEEAARAMRYILQHLDRYSESFRRAALEMVYACYPSEFQLEISRLAQLETNPKRFAICLAYLNRLTQVGAQRAALSQLLESRFPNYAQDAILLSAHRQLKKSAVTLPPFSHIQEHFKGKKILYSFQRPNRDYAGMAIVQDSNGEICRDTEGRLLTFEQFGRSSSNLPYYLTNGNTPQGLFWIEDTASSDNAFIGPTPNLQSRLPYETSLKNFTFGKDSSAWTRALYLSLLPVSWRTEAMEQAFQAGQAGRSEIIAHGTCIDPQYYKQTVYFPFTPSMGCLTGKEIWKGDGTLQYSAQLALINTWLRAGTESAGYLLVIELADLQKPIQPEEIAAYLKR